MLKKLSRRHLGLLLAGWAAAPARAQKSGTTIHQVIDFKISPARIYDVLLDSKQFGAATQDTAEILPKAGERFQLFGGRIEGRNVELIPNQRIVQAWRPASWPPGVYSIVKFELVARGGGTRIVFDHAGFTEDKWETLAQGWNDHYWEPLHKYLAA